MSTPENRKKGVLQRIGDWILSKLTRGETDADTVIASGPPLREVADTEIPELPDDSGFFDAMDIAEAKEEHAACSADKLQHHANNGLKERTTIVLQKVDVDAKQQDEVPS